MSGFWLCDLNLLYQRTFENDRTIRIVRENKMGYKLEITIKIDLVLAFLSFFFFPIFIKKTTRAEFTFSQSAFHSLITAYKIFIIHMHN